MASSSKKKKKWSSTHLHLRPLGWGHLGVIHLDLSFWHHVERLVHDPEGLPHLLHPAQIPGKHTGSSWSYFRDAVNPADRKIPHNSSCAMSHSEKVTAKSVLTNQTKSFLSFCLDNIRLIHVSCSTPTAPWHSVFRHCDEEHCLGCHNENS